MTEVIFKRATANDVDKLGRLSDTVFRSALQPGTGMPKEFSVTFSAENAENLYVAEDGDLPVSLVAIQPGRLWVNQAGIRAISMGSVCTLPEYRKHHYVSELIKQVLADFSASTSVLLVSGGLSIYRRIGCVDFGVRTVWTVNREWTARYTPSEAKVVPFDPDAHSIDALTTLYQAEDYHYERTSAQFKQLFESISVPHFRVRPVPARVFVTVDENQVTSYAIAHVNWRDGKGHVDVLEWAGRRSDWINLAATILAWYQADTLSLSSQVDDAALREILLTCGATAEEVPNQGTVRVLNANLLTQELGSVIAARYGASLTLDEVESEVWEPLWSGASASEPVSADMNHLPQGRIAGYAALSEWFFGSSGLAIQLPHTDDLNYV